MNRKGKVFFKDYFAGVIEETDSGYRFTYENDYLSMENCSPISKTLPVDKEVYTPNTIFSFFVGLIPEVYS